MDSSNTTTKEERKFLCVLWPIKARDKVVAGTSANGKEEDRTDAWRSPQAR